MADNWPAGLPQVFQQQGFAEGVSDGLLETQPEEGPPITRLRSSTSIRPLNGIMICTADQINTFKTFFYTTILGGSLPFNFPDQMQNGTLLVKFPKGNLPNWTALTDTYYALQLNLLVLP